ncbi:MAG: GGDEF domain-containing protein [Candidatus Thiodiazotropha sp. (ex Myrtea spinifera)]|nr:GGDEF domain-containing protein [Candidatus Thiodiazotropha sp. (ex Myrtea spinifera)]MCU7828833.1 GGDEF domain-containing protein [Candidatus Thiodiazotropha sp. (ex Myrtea sp. 'scaly one' KF741663)]
MIKRLISHLATTYRIHSLDQLLDLLSPDEHPSFLQEHRSRLILDRVRFLATLFALLVPLWVIVDVIILPGEILIPILLIRLLSTVGFVLLARSWSFACTHRNSWLTMSLLLINLPITFFASAHYMLTLPHNEANHLAIHLYALLPYIAIGLLGLFPLTAMEGALLTLPLTLITITGWGFYAETDLLQLMPTVWLLFIILGIVFFTSTLQLQYMISLISHSDFDPVTGALTRRSGVENLNREFEKATLNSQSLSVVLVSIDDMQSIIDEYDYATYDHVVLEAADILRDDLRNSDLLVHWSEKRFMLILPSTDCNGATITVNRIRNEGIGTLPDGKPVTASIGVVERQSDSIEDIPSMLELLEQRTQQAKQQGKDRAILCSVP